MLKRITRIARRHVVCPYLGQTLMCSGSGDRASPASNSVKVVHLPPLRQSQARH